MMVTFIEEEDLGNGRDRMRNKEFFFGHDTFKIPIKHIS